GGVSPLAILRAAWADVTHGQLEQGGSTIDQQYVKIVYTGNEPTFARKIREAIIAVKLDHTYSKDEILGRYLNTVYFGNGAFGSERAWTRRCSGRRRRPWPRTSRTRPPTRRPPWWRWIRRPAASWPWSGAGTSRRPSSTWPPRPTGRPGRRSSRSRSPRPCGS